jgi:hypothetical protein
MKTRRFNWGFQPKAMISMALFAAASLLPASRASAEPRQNDASFAEARSAQLRSILLALKEMGVDEQVINTFVGANSDTYSTKLEGGHFDFVNPIDKSGRPLIDVACPHRRCQNGLDFSHNDGTFHRDSANPFNFPVGTMQHLGKDVIYGHLVKYIAAK